MKGHADFSSFSALDLRVGRILSVEDSKARKPTYKITADFGTEVGRKTTVGAFRNYSKEELVGKLIIGLLNVGDKRMGDEVSQFLMLGVENEKREIVFLTPQSEVAPGTEVF